MKSLHKLVAGQGISAFLCVSALAQSSAAELNRFAKVGLSFEHPAEWLVTDESTPQAQQLIVTRKGSSIQITIIAKLGITLSKDLQADKREFADPLVKPSNKREQTLKVSESSFNPPHF